MDAPGPTAVAADLSAVKGEADESTLSAGDIVSGSERERARWGMGGGGGRAWKAAVAADKSAVTVEAAKATLSAGEKVCASARERGMSGRWIQRRRPSLPGSAEVTRRERSAPGRHCECAGVGWYAYRASGMEVCSMNIQAYD